MKKKKSILWFDPNFLWCSDKQEMMNTIRSLLGARFDANAFCPYSISHALGLFISESMFPDIMVVMPEVRIAPEEGSQRLSLVQEYMAWDQSPEHYNSMSVHKWAYGLRFLEFLGETSNVNASGIPIFIFMDHDFHENWQERITAGNGTSHDEISQMIVELKKTLNIVGVFKKYDLSLLTAIQDILEPEKES